MSDIGFDAVLGVTPPAFSDAEAVAIGADTFHIKASGARNLGSERDQTFLLYAEDGSGLAVMKISNPAEDPEVLDMEAEAVHHASRADPGLTFALPWAAPSDAAAFQVRFDAEGGTHLIRMYDVLPGVERNDAASLSDDAIVAWGETTARVGRALRGFFHPRAQRTMLWDVQHTPRTRALLGDVRDPAMRSAVERVLDRFESTAVPVWPRLRAQVVHGDVTIDNALTNESGFIIGVVDFGDMSHSALAIDVASALDSIASRRTGAESFRVARLLIDGYQRITPLEPGELQIMGELWAARCAVTIAISSWRAARGLEDPAFAERYNHLVLETIEHILGLGWDETARLLGGAPPRGSDTALAERRDRVMGPALEPLTYEHPIRMASARGVWMTDVDGRTYLDAYNNVPCVGHAHPRVTEAIARQSRELNTNLRYLHHGAIELAERLVATCSPSLDTVLFVNSGTEANDLAWRLATTFTGNQGGLCTAMAYHGVSHAIAALSPESWPEGDRPTHVETWTPPDPYRGRNEDQSAFSDALERLSARGIAPAATILDGVLTSDGFHDPDPALVQMWVRMTHDAGGVWIADEVQGGHGRTGESMWSFQRHGIEPDLITLGKPMGNGHPVAAVITRREIAERFAEGTVFFSTFGGNPVSAAAGLAVLDVLEDERVLPRVQAAGETLRAAIRDIASRYPAIGDVRGMGLANGVEIVRETEEPDPRLAREVIEGMRERGVLVGSTGPAGNVLKVRPPLAFTTADVPIFAAALEDTLRALE